MLSFRFAFVVVQCELLVVCLLLRFVAVCALASFCVALVLVLRSFCCCEFSVGQCCFLVSIVVVFGSLLLLLSSCVLFNVLMLFGCCCLVLFVVGC